MERLIILGAKQHAKVIVAIAQEFYAKEIKTVGYLDDNPELLQTKLLGYSVLGKLADIENIIKKYGVTCGAIGISNRYMQLREKLYYQLKSFKLNIPSLIHQKAYVSKFASMGDGMVFNPGVVVNAFARVGNNVVIYSNTTIEHETVLEDNVYIGPGVNFSSNVRVGKNTFIGAGAKVIPDVVIGSNVIVGAGSVVIKNIPDNVSVVGVPAKVTGSSSESKI